MIDLEQLLEDQRQEDIPEGLEDDEVHQVARMVEKQVTHLLEHSSIKHTQLEHELRCISGAAARAKYLRTESIQRQSTLEANQVDLEEVRD